MAEALYGPRGYYQRDHDILGARGDFTTTPKLDSGLAGRIAIWVQEAWTRAEKRLPIIELGPGDGTLARDLRKSMGFIDRMRLDYHFVEISDALAKRQQTCNRGAWHRTLKEALAKTGGEGLIISNEFFDAFPVRVFNSDSHELYLDPNRQEVWQKEIDLPDSLLFESLPPRFEVPESIDQWIKKDLGNLKRGEILTIDYGGDANEIYDRRPTGSLRGYLYHQRVLPPELYDNPGRQDITFDLHFPDLIRWSEQIGIETYSLTTQAEFLGIEDNYGAGQAFKVLQQGIVS